MPEYLAPGVYVEEVDLGPKPIEGVGTAMPVFVGFTEKAARTKRVNGDVEIEEVLGQPQLITNWSQYQEVFGDFVDGAFLPQAVYGFFLNKGSRCYVLSVKNIPKATTQLLTADTKAPLTVRAKQAGYGGEQLRVKVELPRLPAPQAEAAGEKSTGSKEKDEEKSAPKKEESPPPPPKDADQSFNLIVERQSKSGQWQEAERLMGVKVEEREEDDQKRVRVVYKNNVLPKLVELVPSQKSSPDKLRPVSQEPASLSLDVKELTPASYKDFQGDELDRTGILGLAAVEDVTMVCVPDLMKPVGKDNKLDETLIKSVQDLMISHCQLMGDRVAILDSPPHKNPQEMKNWRLNEINFDSSYAALYYPWIEVMDPLTNQPMVMPPSGHIAGIWARSDNSRGVHKAPANEVIAGAVGLEYNATKGEQEELNPNGVNCIRAFPGRGIRVWGARTLSSDPAWRYINVRRLFNYVEKSIERGTQWVVFEPNDHKLWARVRRDVSAFLRTVWRDGALFGLTPAEAFYVKCDEELNPSESRDLGRLIIEIGLCPVKPAEFVIFRISQWAGPNAET